MRIGHSPWIEFPVPGELGLMEEHFAIDYRTEPFAQSINGSIIQVDGASKEYSAIENSSTVVAGLCEFKLVRLASNPVPASAQQSSIPMPPAVSYWTDKESILDKAGISSEGIATILALETPHAAILGLKTKGMLEDGVRLLAIVLPNRYRICWTIQILLHHQIMADQQLLQAVMQWRDEPSEPNRSHVASLVPWQKNGCPWTWIMAAISWTGGTLAGSAETKVSPNDQMIVSAVIASLQTRVLPSGRDCLSKLLH